MAKFGLNYTPISFTKKSTQSNKSIIHCSVIIYINRLRKKLPKFYYHSSFQINYMDDILQEHSLNYLYDLFIEKTP